MKSFITFFIRRFTLLFSLLGVTPLYAAQKKQGDHPFKIELGGIKKTIQVDSLNFEKDSVGKLYSLIKKEIKQLSKEQKKYLGIGQWNTQNEETEIERYMSHMEAGLFPFDYDTHQVKISFPWKKNMKLKDADIAKGGTVKLFTPYMRKVVVWSNNRNPKECLDVAVTKPYMDVNLILDRLQELLPENVRKSYLENNKGGKLGFGIPRGFINNTIKRVVYPTRPKRKRVVLARHYVFDDITTSFIDVAVYSFSIKVLDKQEIIKVEGLHNTHSLEDLASYLKSKDFDIGKIATAKGVFDLKNIKENSLLYEAGFGFDKQYLALEKGESDFSIYCPGTEATFSSLDLGLNQKSTVKELFYEVNNVLKNSKKIGKQSFKGPILLERHQIWQTKETEKQRLAEVGITNDAHLVIFQKFKLKLYKEGLEDPVTLDVKESDMTFQKLQEANKGVKEIQGDFVISNKYGYIIPPTAILPAAIAGINEVEILNPKELFYTEVTKDNNTTRILENFPEHLTMDSFTQEMNERMESTHRGLLLTEYKHPLTIQYALNKVGNQKANTLFYHATDHPEPVRMTLYEFTVEWMQEGIKQSKKITQLQPYQTVLDLLAIMKVKDDQFTAVTVEQGKTYQKEDFSRTTLVQLGAEINKTIKLKLVQQGGTTSLNDDTTLDKKEEKFEPPLKKTVITNNLLHDSKQQGKGDSPLDDQNKQKDGKQDHNEKRWDSIYLYWIGIPIALVLVIGGCWLLMKKKIMKIIADNQDDN